MMDHNLPDAKFHDGPHGRLAYLAQSGRTDSPGLVWLGGYASDMRGSKAEAIAAHAAQRNLANLRFDYSGHGESDGAFDQGTIGQWSKDAAHMVTTHTTGPQILIGSSMGAWIAGLLARSMPERVAALILIAPAPDFTSDLTPNQWPQELWEQLQSEGRIDIPSAYDESVMTYTKALFDEGEEHRLLNQPLPYTGPVRILTGMADEVVPWQHAVRYGEHFDSTDVSVTLVKGGDHRLSSPEDISRLRMTIDMLTESLNGK